MTTDNEFITNNRDYLIKQSEMLQTIINRMAGNSLAVKKLGLTIWTALIGFGFTNKISSLFILAIISICLLGLLDMYYLYLERRFRSNFNGLTELLCGFENKELNIQELKGNFIKLKQLNGGEKFQMYISTFKSWANLPYLVILFVSLIILILR